MKKNSGVSPCGLTLTWAVSLSGWQREARLYPLSVAIESGHLVTVASDTAEEATNRELRDCVGRHLTRLPNVAKNNFLGTIAL